MGGAQVIYRAFLIFKSQGTSLIILRILTTTLISTGASSDDYKLMSAGIFTFVFSILLFIIFPASLREGRR